MICTREGPVEVWCAQRYAKPDLSQLTPSRSSSVMESFEECVADIIIPMKSSGDSHCNSNHPQSQLRSMAVLLDIEVVIHCHSIASVYQVESLE